jgi:chitin-binding protein
VTAVRKIAAAGVAPLVVLAMAAPAGAHGAMTDPISRAAACGPEGGSAARSAACRAARAAGDAAALREWDNLKVPGVAGRDRRLIPDGRLCSGGLDAYRGLDLPRPDWPATRLTSGARFTFGYRTTIPHRGTFRLYVTRTGYDPARRLKWSDLEPRPFAAVADPPLRNGSYVMKGRLPRGKSGRHMIFTIWRNSSTPDTYYSCSDVVFGGASGAAGGGAGKRESPASTPTPAPHDSAGAGAGDADGQYDSRVELEAGRRSSSLPFVTAGVVIAAGLAGGAAFLLVRRGRRRAGIGQGGASR